MTATPLNSQDLENSNFLDPDLPLPIGADPTASHLEWCDWDDAGRRFRIVETVNCQVGSAQVYGYGLQLSDGGGAFHGGDADGRDRPGISMDYASEHGWVDTEYNFTPEEARQVAHHLLKTADVVERWSAPVENGRGPADRTCAFSWCENTWEGHREHAWHDSVPGANVNGRSERIVSTWTSV